MTNINKDETELAALVNETAPERWKIFQMLVIEGENAASSSFDVPPLSVRQAPKAVPFLELPVSINDFKGYVSRNNKLLLPTLRDKGIIKAEDNEVMRSSYIIIDEFGRFLDNSKGAKTPSRPILNANGDIDIDSAAFDLLGRDQRGFDRDAFQKRDGYYSKHWSRLDRKN